MKMRDGFVSNSSSSSFVLIMTDDLFEEKIAGLSDDRKTIIKKLFNDNTFVGQPVKIYSELDIHDYSSNEYIFEELHSTFENEDVYDVFCNFKDNIGDDNRALKIEDDA